MKRLLAVIDYQNDFVSGALGFPAAAEIDDGIAELVQDYLGRGDDVLFTYDTHDADYLETREGRALPVPHCLSDSMGWWLYGKTQLFCRDTCLNAQIHTVRKQTFAMRPEDAAALRERLGPVDDILLVGVVTNMCVLSNAIMLQAAWPEAQLTVNASLCRSFDPALGEKALDVMEGLQIRVVGRV